MMRMEAESAIEAALPEAWKGLLPQDLPAGVRELPGAPEFRPFDSASSCPAAAARVLRSLVALPPEWQGAAIAESPQAYVHRRADMPAYCVLVLECRERLQEPEALEYVEWLLGTEPFAGQGLVILLPGKRRKRPVLGVSLLLRDRRAGTEPLHVAASLPPLLPEAERAYLAAAREADNLPAFFAAWTGVLCRYALQKLPLPGLPAATEPAEALALYRRYRQLLAWFRESMYRCVTAPDAADAATLLAQLVERADALRAGQAE